MRWLAVAASVFLVPVTAQVQWSVQPTYTACSTAILQLTPSASPTADAAQADTLAESHASSSDPNAETPERPRKRQQSQGTWDIYVYDAGVPQSSSVDVATDGYTVGSVLKMQSAGSPTPSTEAATNAVASRSQPTPSPQLNGDMPISAEQPQEVDQTASSDVPELDGGRRPATSLVAFDIQRRSLASRGTINMTLIEKWAGGELHWKVDVPPGTYRLNAISTTDPSQQIESDAFSVQGGNDTSCVPASLLPQHQDGSNLDWRAVVGIVVGGVSGIILIGLLTWLIARKCRQRRSKPLDESFWTMYSPTRAASMGRLTPSGPSPAQAQVPDYSYYGNGDVSLTSLPRPPVLVLRPKSTKSARSFRSFLSKGQPSEKLDIDSQIHVTYNAYAPGTGAMYTPLELEVQTLAGESKNDVALEHELRALFRHNQKDHYTDLEAAVMTLLDRPGEKPLGPEIQNLYEEVMSKRAMSSYSGFTERASLDTLRTQCPPPVRPARPPSANLPDELSPQVQVASPVRPGSTTTLLSTLMGRKRRSQQPQEQQEDMRAEIMRSPDGEDEKRFYQPLNYNNY